ncbi:hypothetical protein ABMC88_16945 [Sulfitobacter sp. HNIBRBA2951]|uniref:hypothetical protein n=1 Tax=Sulfitobacter aquimarinus TaxID=3158557 RepID=UPI0032DF158C
MDRTYNRRRGFALIVVLSTLSIIALLFAIASNRAINRLSDTRTDFLVAQDAQDRTSLLALAAQVYGDAETPLATDMMLPVQWRGENAELRLQDAGGLIDLNTANPAMLERLATALEVTPAQLEAYRVWRRAPLRLQRTSDFVRVTGGDAALRESLLPIATVFSGRPGIAVELAPIELLEHLTGSTGSRDILIRELQTDWVSPPSGANYHVTVMNKGDQAIHLGVINVGSTANGLIISSF